MTSIKNLPAVLIILDGWGIASDAPGNAISRAKTINIELNAPTKIYLKVASRDSALPLIETSAYELIDAISKKT